MSTTKTQTGTSNSTATYGRMPGAESPDINTLRGQQFQVDPTIGFRAGAAKRRLASSFINPTSGFYTPAMERTIKEGQGRDIDQEAAMQSRAGQYDVNQQNYQKNAYLAGLTAPPLVQTGASGNTTSAYKTPFSSKILPALQAGAGFAAGV